MQSMTLPFSRVSTIEEHEATKAIIATQTHNLAAINEDIASLMHIVQELQAKKFETIKYIQRCRGLIVLARRLPVEVLAMIVSMCISDYGNAFVKTPLYVSQVCSEWRAIVQVPSAWSILDLDVGYGKRHVVEQAKLWLSRSENVPLHITLRLQEIPADFRDLTALLCRCANRCKALTITAQVFSDVVLALSLLRSSYSALQYLYVASWFEGFSWGGDADNVTNVLDFEKVLGHTPLLRELRIGRGCMNFANNPSSITSLNIHLRSANLSSFLSPSSETSVLRFLADLPCLETLSIEMASERPQPLWEEDFEVRIVDMLHLRSLDLAGQLDLFRVLNFIHAPTLSSMRLRSVPMFNDGQQDNPVPPVVIDDWLCSFLTRSRPTLEDIQLHEIDLQLANFGRFFLSVPHMKNLQLHESDINDDTLELLQGPDGLCPKLQKLDLRWCGSVSGAALVALVEDRQHNSPAIEPIQEIAVINCSLVKDKDVASLAEQTLCRVVTRSGDIFCRSRECCKNDKYTLRLRINLGSKKIQLPNPSTGKGLIV